jgi:hypothetical protein
MLSFVSLGAQGEYAKSLFVNARMNSFRVFSLYAKILFAYMENTLNSDKRTKKPIITLLIIVQHEKTLDLFFLY